MERKASAQWNGGLKDGKGAVSTASGALKGVPYSFAMRFGDSPRILRPFGGSTHPAPGERSRFLLPAGPPQAGSSGISRTALPEGILVSRIGGSQELLCVAQDPEEVWILRERRTDGHGNGIEQDASGFGGGPVCEHARVARQRPRPGALSAR